MKTLLRILFRPEPQRETAAWFIDGADSRGWLEEIALWQVDTQSLVLAVISDSHIADSQTAQPAAPAVCGVLVTAAAPIRPAVYRLARPWGCVAGRLYLPVEAAIEPAVESQEIAALLPDAALLAWHPQRGLIGFESETLLKISNLLRPPQESQARWDHAQPGPAFAKRLVSITAEELPSVEDVIEEGQGDIGTESDQIDELPPADGETRPGSVKQAFDDFRKAIARKVQSFTSKAPRNSDKRTWVDGLEEWAGRVLDKSILRKRMESMNRLLSLLDRDPEEGLRKAIPFGGDESFRGRSRPGSELADRDVDFRMPGQWGGGAGDYWEVPWEIQHLLQAKYRELANREVQLGRHRRAAYILANLLGDYHSAARTLEAGGHYLEAATLHRDHLRQPLEAARCLERGGVLHQAIEIYELHAWFEDAARLHEQLDQHDSARECWAKSIWQARANRNYLHAAELIHTKFDDPNGALVILRSGWDESIQSQDCLGEWFRLSGELGQHELAAGHAKDLSHEDCSTGKAAELVKVLAKVTHSYPDGIVRQQSADSARVVTSRQLEAGSSGFAPLLHSLREVDRSDRLLARDCERFENFQAGLRPPGPETRFQFAESIEIEELASCQLERLDEMAVCSTRLSLFLAGYDGADQLQVRHYDWEDLSGPDRKSDPVVSVAFSPPVSLRPLLAVREDNLFALVHSPGQTPFEDVPAGVPSGNTVGPYFGGTGWLRADGTLAVAWDAGGLAWHVARDDSDLRLECYDWQENLVSSRSLVSAIGDPLAAHMLTQAEDLSELNIDLIAAHNRCFLRIGNNVYIVGSGGAEDHVQLESSIFDMAVSPALTRMELAVAGGRGVYVFPNGQWIAPDILMTDLRRAKICYTRDGMLVGVDGDGCVVEDTQGEQIARLKWQHREFPVAVVPTNLAVTFAVVFADGLVRVMRVV